MGRAPVDRFDVVVIGSGMGGSACAALLARAGVRVVLLEKNPRIGGSCSWYERSGYHVDYGTHLFSRGERGPFGLIQRRLGLEERIRFVRVSDLAEIRGPGVRLVLPAQAWRLPAFLVRAVRALGVPPREWPRAARLFERLVTMPPSEIATWNHRTVEDLLLEHTENPQLLGLLGLLLGLYFILPFWEVSAGEAIFCFQRMARDNRLSYPLGGSSAIPCALVEAAERYGAHVERRAAVVAIEPPNGRPARVVLRDGRELFAKAVVSSTSLRDLVFDLVDSHAFPPAYVESVRRLKASYVAVQAKVGVRRRRERAGCIVGGVSFDPSLSPLALDLADFRGLFAELENGRVPRILPVYCPIPSNFDPSLAPPDHQLFTACAVAPTTDVATRTPDATNSRAQKTVDDDFIAALLRALDELCPGLLDEAEFVDTMGVAALASWIGKRHGPAVSTGQTPGQVAARRPSVRTPVRGLYACGDAAGGRGIGTELATTSGMECADALLADLQAGLL